jgi:peptidoglycan/LPS O-acetylase OafA/YrhL
LWDTRAAVSLLLHADGLSTVAIILVFACHTMASAFPGGWIGVDVVLVRSGYLITAVLLHEL